MLNFADEKALIKWVLNQQLPSWQAGLFKRHSQAVQVHSQGQLFYKLNSLFPNEHPASKAHRILSFESITEASFGRAANNVNRIFKNSSYTVEASERTIGTLGAEVYGEGSNFYTWFLDEWTKWALKEDPNARFVVYPPEYVAEGNPPVGFVASEHIRYIGDDAFVFISEEESDTTYELQEVRVRHELFYDQSINRPNMMETRENTYAPVLTATIKRPVYHVFLNGIGFYRIEQLFNKDEKGNDYLISIYPIEGDFIPVSDVGGHKGKKNVNKSFLHPFVSFGNLALLQHSQHTAVNFTFSFPRMSEIISPCDAQGCQDGWIDCDITDTYPLGKKKCSFCGGTGEKSNQSPYKIYKKKYDPLSGGDDDAKLLSVPDVQYYTPPTAILDYSKKEWKEYLEEAEKAVYVQQRVKTGNVESAESKNIDREDMYSFFIRVGQTFFSRMRFAVQCFENYLNSNPIRVSVTPPYSYAILSEGEAFDELKNILESKVPVMIKANKVETFINKFVSQSSPLRKFLDVLKLVDLLLYYNADELVSFKIGGVVSPEALNIHVYAYPVLQRMYYENKNIFQLETGAIAAKLQTELDKIKPEPVQDLKTKLINQNNPGNEE